MAYTTTPTVLDAQSIIAAQVLARGSAVSGTIDLRTAIGAWIFAKIGRGGTTALSGGTTPGVDVIIRRIINNNVAVAGGMSSPVVALLSQTAAAASTTCATSNSNAGQAVLTVASGSGFAAGDIICIQDSGAGVTRLEFQRISKIATNVFTLDENLAFTHTSAGADTVRNKSDVFAPVWVDGGSLISVIFDYGDDTAGESCTVISFAQVETSIGTV